LSGSPDQFQDSDGNPTNYLIGAIAKATAQSSDAIFHVLEASVEVKHRHVDGKLQLATVRGQPDRGGRGAASERLDAAEVDSRLDLGRKAPDPFTLDPDPLVESSSLSAERR
jgi:hypothetical protein